MNIPSDYNNWLDWLARNAMPDEQLDPQDPRESHRMTEEEYFASEYTDEEIARLADAGDFFLDENGFNYRLNAQEIEDLVAEGNRLLYFEHGIL